jgi:hypothetical protein
MALDQGYVVDAAVLPTSACATRPLWAKCDVMLRHADASLQQLSVLVSFVQWLRAIFRVSQYFSLLSVVFGGRNSHSRRPSQSQNTVAIVFFFADGSILNFFLVAE